MIYPNSRRSAFVPVSPAITSKTLAAGSVLAVLLASAASPAHAAAPATASEDVTVTARRRSEPLQKTPVAVSLLTAKQAANVNVHDLQGMLQLIPSAEFRTNASAKDRTVFIRGIGTISTSPGVEPSVSTVIDGVVLARSGQATADLLDLDHIEVLRGPQGTLFGKNASAGVVNIVTAAPTAERHAYLDGSYFSGNEYRIAGGVSGTLVPNRLTGSVSVLLGGYDGNVGNTTLDREVNGYLHRGFRSKLAWTPDALTVVTLGLDYIYSDDNVPNGIFTGSSRIAYPTNVVTGSAPLAAALASEGIVPSDYNATVAQNLQSRSVDKNGGASVAIDRKLGGGYDFTSISAYRRWQNSQSQDYDQLAQASAGLPEIRDQGWLDFYQVSEEARVASPKGHFLDYVAGLYYLHADDSETYDRRYAPLGTAATAGHAGFGTVGNNYAAFGEGNLNFTRNFRAILGLRVLRDDLSYDFGRVSTSGVAVTGIRPGYASTGSTASNGYGDRIGLQYDLSPDLHGYFTYSRGYKGPAYNVFFNMQNTDSSALKPETNNSYELGLKSQFLHHRVTANLAAFIEDFSNYQANFLDTVAGGTVTRLINAGSVSSKGLEADLSARPLHGLTLGLNAAYTYAVVDQFNCPAGSPLSCDVNGGPLPFAPRWKMLFSADYTRPLSERLQLSLDSSYTWQSRTQYSLAETQDTAQGAYGIWNLSVAIADLDARWRVAGILRNALDTHYVSNLSYGNLAGVVSWLNRDYGRYGGIELHKDF